MAAAMAERASWLASASTGAHCLATRARARVGRHASPRWLRLHLVVATLASADAVRDACRPTRARARVARQCAPVDAEASQDMLAASRPWHAVREAMHVAVRSHAPPSLPGDEQPWSPPLLPAPPPPPRAHGPRERTTWAMSVAYFGPAFRGYAYQPDLPTVHGTLEAAIAPLLRGKHALVLSSAGRTDAGVSAVGQLVSFYSWVPLEPEQLRAAVDGAAPGVLRMLSAARVPRSFHATFSARWRRYVYLLPGAASDVGVLDAESLRAQLEPLAGAERDFAALGRGLPPGKRTSARLLRCSARAVQVPVAGTGADGGVGCVDAVRIDVVGSRFIRRQVRTLVATAVHAASQYTSSDDTHALLRRVTSGKPEWTAPPAPAEGLCFVQASYDPADDDPMWSLIEG